jgi:hypothetical protein
MDMVANLCALLDRKKALFSEYERATLALLDCAFDDAEHYITERGRIATEIDGVVDEIEQGCGQLPDAAVLLACVTARIGFDHVPGGYQCVYYSGQAVNSVIQRIAHTEEQVMERLKRLRGEALDSIRQNRDLPKIRKDLADLTEASGGGLSLTDSKV